MSEEKFELIAENEKGEIVLTYNISNQLAMIEQQMKELKEIQDSIKESLMKEMETKKLLKVENEEIAITYVAPTYRETFDSKAFKKDHEDLYNDYTKLSDVKASLRIKVK